METGESHGRVEVFHSGTWGTVCDYNWDLRDANVVCRQLGFPSALTATKNAASGRGQGMIWMDNVQCTGRESSLTECGHRGWGKTSYCDHDDDAGVTCAPGTVSTIFFGLASLFILKPRCKDL